MKLLKNYRILLVLVFIQFCAGASASTGIVTNTNDSGPGSLRYMLTSTSNDTIRFDPSLIGSGSSNIHLTSRIDVTNPLHYSQPLVIIGLYNSLDTLSISGSGELFNFEFTNLAGGKLIVDSIVCKNSIGVMNFTRIAQLEVKNSVFRNNNCVGNSNSGSVILVPNSLNNTPNLSVSLFNTSFSNNTGHSGVALQISNSTATVRNLNIDKCTFNGNIGATGSNGGALLVRPGGNTSSETYVTIERSTFVDNSAAYEGAISIEDNPSFKFYVYIEYCTVVGNISGSGTPAIVVKRDTDNGFHRCDVLNNIIALNNSSATNKNFKYYLGSTEDGANSDRYNIFSGVYPLGFTATTNLIGTSGTIDLGPLQNNGGTTKTRMPNAGSIAIDAGDPNELIDAQNLPIVGVRDIGAAEYSACAQDAIAPIADNASLADLTDLCSITSLTPPTATDNCAGSVIGTHNSILPITSTSTITWTYDDGNGNTSTQTQNVVITDNTAPVVDVTSLSNVTAECSVTSLTAPTATDNCSGSITGTHNVSLPIATQGTTTVTWSYDDGNGNTSTQTQDVVIDNITAPVADVASLSNVTDECTVSSLTAPTATDNCVGTITGTHNASLPITTQGTTTVTWTYDDGNGNTSTQTQDIVISDVTAPVADVATLSNVTAECEVTSLTAPTATDNCAGSITGTHNASLPITTQGTTTVTWTYDDGNGNTSTQTQDVVITDVTAPVADAANLADIDAECDVTPTAPTAADNCAGTITATQDVSFPITSSGTTTVTWTYDDGNGNTSTQTQDVIITPIDNGVTQVDAITLSADASGYSYQWVDCNDNNSPIAGETNQTFEATSNGSYAVIIDNGDCSVTSTCSDITTVGLDKNEIQTINVFPNPTSGTVTINSSTKFNFVELVNLMGQVVYTTSLNEVSTHQIELPEAKGVYLIKVTGNNTNNTFRIIKK